MTDETSDDSGVYWRGNFGVAVFVAGYNYDGDDW